MESSKVSGDTALTSVASLSEPEPDFEVRKNHLSNELLQEELARNRQRKFQRKCLFLIAIFVAIAFAILFGIIAFKLYLGEPDSLLNIPTAWAFPLVAMLALPTLLFVILALCAYRETPKITPETLSAIISRLVSNS